MFKKILLTGGGGLIGQPTLELLDKKGYRVVTVGIGEENAIAEFDLAKKDLSRSLAKDFDYVVHLAAQLPKSGRVDVYLANQKIDDNIFKFVGGNQIPLIYASGASVYGFGNSTVRIDENFPCKPEGEYIKQKVVSENWIKKNLKNYYICRISAPYAASSRYQGVLNTFCKMALAGDDLTLYGTGSRCQDFIHSKDVANLVCKIIESPAEKPGIYNICSGSTISMKEVGEMILRLAESSGGITFRGIEDPQENFKALYNIDKTVKAFDWKPKIQLEEGIAELLSFLK